MTYIAHYLTRKADLKDLLNLFTTLDKDGNGFLSKQEISEGFESIFGTEMLDVNSVFDSIDRDKNGLISYDGCVIKRVRYVGCRGREIDL